MRQIYSSPEKFFGRELQRTRPRRYVLFTLEPTFIIASNISSPPPDEILRHLDTLITFAKTVKPGDIEIVAEDDQRYAMELLWFEKILKHWRGKVTDNKLDGSPWEGGWNM